MEQDESGWRYAAYAGRLRNIARVGYRYLAFTSDLGEAVRPVVRPFIVNAAYGISFAYVGADIAYHVAHTRHTTQGNPKQSELVTRAFIQQSVFQGLASLLLPALTIHTAVDQMGKILRKRTSSIRLQRFGPSITGLAIIPLLPVFLDHPVESLVDKVFNISWPIKE